MLNLLGFNLLGAVGTRRQTFKSIFQVLQIKIQVELHINSRVSDLNRSSWFVENVALTRVPVLIRTLFWIIQQENGCFLMIPSFGGTEHVSLFGIWFFRTAKQTDVFVSLASKCTEERGTSSSPVADFTVIFTPAHDQLKLKHREPNGHLSRGLLEGWISSRFSRLRAEVENVSRCGAVLTPAQ